MGHPLISSEMPKKRLMSIKYRGRIEVRVFEAGRVGAGAGEFPSRVGVG